MPSAVPFASLSRALVIKLRHHGDVLLSAPVFSALKRAAPQCEVDGLVYADTAPMLAGHPDISRLFTIDRNWKRQGLKAQASAEWALLSRLRARRYDLIVHLTVHPRGAWLARLLRPRWSVGPRRPDAGAFWHSSFTHLYAAQSHPDRHTVDTHLDALRALGMEVDLAAADVALVPGPDAEARIDALMAQHGLMSGRFVHLHPASRWRFKCWPADRVAALCDALAPRGLPLVLTCAPDPKERDLVAAVRAAARVPTIDLSGALSLKELAALTARARLFVGVDSAPMHMACAMGTPVVAIFGPSGDREWGPWHTESRIVVSADHAHCRPCGRDGCNGSKISECLTTLPVAQVLAACEELLGS
ncbi:MAG: putative lipopolysaccharide heptosyltransferase III [Ignavibacteria bacterium]